MAVYGIAENKCLKEVVAKDNFIVLEGTLLIEAKNFGLGQVTVGSLGVAYADWNPDEWVVVGRMIRLTDDNPQKWFAPYYSGNANTVYNVNPAVRLDYRPAQVAVGIYNHYDEKKRFTYKVVLMKVK